MLDTQSNTKTSYERHALNISTRADKALTNSQERAIDLYKRGFNVFPLPYGKKEPFAGTSLKRLYNSRPHLCGDGVEPCRHSKTPFASLFMGQKNIAVMCGKTSGNLLAIDCDTHAAYEFIGKQLDALGLPYWAFTSHRGGCYLLRVIEGETVNVAKAGSEFEGVELWGNSHYVVVPLSVHPSGTVYRWRGDTEPRFNFATSYQTLPAVSVTALTWLGVKLLKDDKPQAKPFESFGLAEKYFVLSERNRKTLAHGANEGERNRFLTSLAYDMKGNDLDYEDVEADFLRAAELCDPTPYPKHKAVAILKSAYAKQRTRARKDNNTGEPTAQIQRLYAFVNSFDWQATFKRKARTRRAVFVACVERSAIEGASFRAAIRELAETVNRSYQYVSVCLHDLLDAGLLKLVTSWDKSASGGNVYVFGDIAKLLPKKDSITTTCNINVSFWQYEKNTNTDAWKDVFGLKGLGVVAVEVLKGLQANRYKSIYAIAKDTGTAYTSVKRAVNLLVKHGLAIHSESEGLYYAEAVTDNQLLTLSVKLQTNGRAEMQRIAHNIDREVFINRNLLKAMQAYNAVTGEKRESVTLSTVSLCDEVERLKKPEKKQPKQIAQLMNNLQEWRVWDGCEQEGVYLEFRKNSGRTECRNIDYAEFKRRENKKLEEAKKRAYELVSKFAKNKAAVVASRPNPVEAAYEFLEWLANKGNEEAAELIRRAICLKQ